METEQHLNSMPAFFNAISNFSIGGIVTDNLSLHLNVTDTNSYPGSGSTWSDLSSNSNHATLYNSPTYDSGNGGYLSFDGVNDYGDDSSTSGSPFAFGTGDFTYEAWVRYKWNGTRLIGTCLEARRRDTANSTNFGWSDFMSAASKWSIFRATVTAFTSNATFSQDTWYHVVFSRASGTANFYVNNSLDKTQSFTFSFSDYGVYYLARNKEATPNYAFVDLGQIRTYKGKALTAAEVEQNWNATKSNYGY